MGRRPRRAAAASLDRCRHRFAEPDGTWAVNYEIGLARWNDPDSDPWFARDNTGDAVVWW